jgi:hypothetical protein
LLLEQQYFVLTFPKPAIYERESYDGSESEPDVYQYIVPVGVDVIFQDEAGNEIARYVLPNDVERIMFDTWI